MFRGRRRLRRMVTGAGQFEGSMRVAVSSSGGVDGGIIVAAAAAAIMAGIIVGGISTIPERGEVVWRRVTFTSRIDHRSEITTTSSNSSRITEVDGRETPEEEEEEGDSGTEAEVGRMSSSRSGDR